MGLLCAALGTLTAYFFLQIMGGFNSPPMIRLMPPMIFGVLVLFVVSGYFGTKAGVYLCWKGNKTGLDVLIGLGLAFGSIAVSVWASSVFYIFFHDRNEIIAMKDIPAILFTPMLVILLFGAIPAAVLGVVYGLLVGMQLERTRV